MHRTAFAGLTALDENDNITVDGGSFLTVNTPVIDRLLQIGCVTHRHDAHPGIATPTGTLSATVSQTGGQLEAGLTLFMGYTLIDSQGGETDLSPVVATNTQAAIVPGLEPPTASADYSGGRLPIGGYSYAVSYRDEAGGQTELQPAVFVTREAGFASGQVILHGLSTGLASGLVLWELWRADEGGEYNLIESGSSDTFTDTGLKCTDCSATPPTVNTTNHTGQVTIQLPTPENDPAVASATALSVYLSSDGSFSNPSLFGTFPVASAGNTFSVLSLVLETGAPPSVNRSIPGAGLIDPDSESSTPWKKAVANAAALPVTGNRDGDLRETLNDHAIHVWNGESESWETTTGGGGGSGHIIQSPASVDQPPEPKLQFAGSGVAVTDDPAHNRTIVTITPGTTITYRGVWNGGTTYHGGDIVARGGGSYLALGETTGNDPSTDEGLHWGILALPGAAGSGGTGVINWMGAWSNVTTYAQDDAVSFGGGSYLSLIAENVGNNPSTKPADWATLAEPGRGLKPQGPWLVGTTYTIQDLVERNGNAYVSKVEGNTGNDPALDTEEVHWSLFVTKGETGAGEAGPPGSTWRGPYSSGTTYKVRDAVQRAGSTYISVSEANKGNDPATDGEVHWQLVAEHGAPGPAGPKGSAGLRYRGEYSGVVYQQYDVVKSAGKFYVSYKSGAQSGHAPPNATYWEIFHGEGPSESKVWPIGEPEAGALPGLTTRINRSEARQQIVGLDLRIEVGEATVTVRQNGAGITHLTNITVVAGSPKYVDMTSLSEGGEGGKVFPFELADGGYVDLEIVTVSSESLGFSATLHIEHVIWGDV